MFRKYAKNKLYEQLLAFEPKFVLPQQPPGCRPCLVDDKPASFHCWVRYEEERMQIDYFVKPDDRKKILRDYQETGVMDAAGHIEKVLHIAALVEYPDGSVGRVKPELITFLDRREG